MKGHKLNLYFGVKTNHVFFKKRKMEDSKHNGVYLLTCRSIALVTGPLDQLSVSRVRSISPEGLTLMGSEEQLKLESRKLT